MRTATLNKLTARAVKFAGDGMHSDGGGLFLRVKGNSRGWVFRFTRDGRKREMGLGSASSVSLAKAREKAVEARALVSAGIDPIVAKSTSAETASRRRVIPTFDQAARSFITARQPTWSNPKHVAQWSSTLEMYARPLMHLPVDEIGADDVAQLLEPIWLTKAETARRVRGRIEKILGASIALGHRAPPNPAAWKDNLEHILPDQRRVARVKHHAAVPVDEAPSAFARLWRKRRDGAGYAALVTLMLTGLRSGEVRRLEWGDIHVVTNRYAGPVIMLPAERMKARRDHVIPVTWPLALHLSEQPRWAGTELVHPGSGGRSISDMTLAMAMRRSGLGEYTPHGWRSTYRDWAAQAGWVRELAEHQLAHSVGTKVERAYQRDTLVDQRRPMMKAWSSYLVGEL